MLVGGQGQLQQLLAALLPMSSLPSACPPSYPPRPLHPQTMWVLGGTWLLLGAVVEVSLLYVLDQL